MRMFRFAIGRALIHTGLRIMPPGRVRSELFQMLELWGSRVRTKTKEGRE